MYKSIFQTGFDTSYLMCTNLYFRLVSTHLTSCVQIYISNWFRRILPYVSESIFQTGFDASYLMCPNLYSRLISTYLTSCVQIYISVWFRRILLHVSKSIFQTGLYASLPHVSKVIVSLASGVIADVLMKTSLSMTVVRKILTGIGEF